MIANGILYADFLPFVNRDPLSELFARLRAESQSEFEKGRRFELLMKAAFERHPGEYGPDRFRRVWMWIDWPDRKAMGFKGDIGIDLVAEQTDAYGGGLCAIQCKFYAEESTVPTTRIDSFLAASESFKARILVPTGGLTVPAQTKVRKAKPRCEQLGVDELSKWQVDWIEFLDQPDSLEFGDVKHEPRDYQSEATDAVIEGFGDRDEGQMLLPCGTGKSVVALWIAEQMVGAGGRVLYLVPSISLMGQTMREWARQKSLPHRYLGVCSDRTTGRQDDRGGDLTELAMPVTTDPTKVFEGLDRLWSPRDMAVVFCTYQSLERIAWAQKNGAAAFDLVICDEAHRTTGVGASKKELAGFQLVHDRDQLLAECRLFMTATPRIFTPRAKKKAANQDHDSFSMDDESLYGPAFYQMGFADAVDSGWLSDYEVVVIGVDKKEFKELHAADREAQHEKLGIVLDDYVKLAGCWDALADPTTERVVRGRRAGEVNSELWNHSRTAIAFTNRVNTSKKVAYWWPKVVDRKRQADGYDGRRYLQMGVEHMDGSTQAMTRHVLLEKLRSHGGDREGNTDAECKVISNARVLTEGVDVPALDAVIFLERRTSKIDITQAVGRVMRTAPGKKVGYVVIPVVVEEGSTLTSREVLAGSDFNIVWDVVRALRSHDERIDYWINNINAAKRNGKVRVLPPSGSTDDPEDDGDATDAVAEQLRFNLELDDRIASKLVDMAGDKKMWPTWGKRAAWIANAIRVKMADALAANPRLAEGFARFTAAMKGAIGKQVTEYQAQEMISQHVVTIPIFDAFFGQYGFADENPISAGINELLKTFEKEEVTFHHELRPLTRAYGRMADAFEGALDGGEKLDVLRQVYDGFFKAAMIDAVKRLGIVYTPVPLVDFMVKSVDAVCRKEFGRGITAPEVHVLDPFAGTGTFLNRLLTLKDASGQYLIRDEDLARKYRQELHANEIVLLAYYIAALSIEEAAQARGAFADGYTPFEGVVLADTFFMDGKRADQLFGRMADNVTRAQRQHELPIRVIIANPPWSVGQKSASDDNPNPEYDRVGEKVAATYGEHHRRITGKGAGKAQGNLYVKSFRWASDRLNAEEGGVLAFIHPNSLATAPSLAGMRAAIRDEFTSIYVINLRGDAYKQGEERQAESDNVFGQGSRNGVQVTLLVRNPQKDPEEPSELHYAEVPAYSSLAKKLEWLEQLGDATSQEFVTVPVTDQHDWTNLTEDSDFNQLLPVCDTARGKLDNVATHKNALGLTTNCDVFVYSFSREALIAKVEALIEEYEDTRFFVNEHMVTLEDATKNTNPQVIKWTGAIKGSLKANKKIEFDESRIREVLYRPFTKLWLYEDHRLLGSVKTISAMFPRRDESNKESNTGDAVDSGEISAIAGGGGGRRHFAKQQSDLRSPRHNLDPRHASKRNHPTQPSHTTEAILISGASNMTFQALASMTIPDLAAIKGSQQTRAIVRHLNQ